MRRNSQYAMFKTTYHISLKDYVGGYEFDHSTVDEILAKNEGKEVNVLIDSLGGSLATGLSISAAFRNHGRVNVHFVGLDASAATIASLEAAHISIDAGAMQDRRPACPDASCRLTPPKEAIDCGFVIEITDREDELAPCLIDALTSVKPSFVIIVTIPAHHMDSHYFCMEDSMERLIGVKIKRKFLRAFNQVDLM